MCVRGHSEHLQLCKRCVQHPTKLMYRDLLMCRLVSVNSVRLRHDDVSATKVMLDLLSHSIYSI